MMHNNIKFSNKMFGGLEDIFWVNSDNLTLRCGLDLEHRNPFFPQDALAYDSLSSDQSWSQKNQQFRRYRSQSHILIIWTRAMTLTLKTANNFFPAQHSGSWCCITEPSLVTKCYVVQKISSRQTFTNILNLCCDLDLQSSNPIFPQDTPAYVSYDAVLSYQIWLHTDQQV